MHDQIDKIQKEIDALIRLCAECGPDGQDALGAEDKFTKLGYLLLKMQEGDLEEKHFETLQKWLDCDREALDFYLEFQDLSAMLYSYYQPERSMRLLEQIQESLAARNN
jgi:hypothetical protein